MSVAARKILLQADPLGVRRHVLNDGGGMKDELLTEGPQPLSFRLHRPAFIPPRALLNSRAAASFARMS